MHLTQVTCLPKHTTAPLPGCHPFQRKYQTGIGYRGSYPAESAARCTPGLVLLQLAPHLPGHREVITAYRPPVPVSLQDLEHRPAPARADAERELRERGPNRISSARIHGGAARLPRRERPAIQPPAPSRTDTPAMQRQHPRRELAACRLPRRPRSVRLWICPEPRHSRHERRTHSAWPRVSVPTVQARRERRNFHPWPPAGRAAILPVIGPTHEATIHDISLRTNYTWGSHSEMTCTRVSC